MTTANEYLATWTQQERELQAERSTLFAEFVQKRGDANITHEDLFLIARQIAGVDMMLADVRQAIAVFSAVERKDVDVSDLDASEVNHG